MIFIRSFLLALCLTNFASAQRCDNGPCALGCCNEEGWCGYGPAYCGRTCKQDCDRKSECDPGFGSEWAERDKCPLNVCCSKDAFCGTTKEFCGNKQVSRPKCSKTHGNSRIVGYYEGWASNRPCNVFRPEKIPVGLYTHINFAFATINPKTFKVSPSSEEDVKLYERLMLHKEKDPGLKVYIAIGGWTFNDPGPTATTFSDLSASIPRQRIFIESLISFMATYGFDGVDLDWEYPVADDRSGREVDFANFPKFMKRLKQSLDFASKGLTITLPASYWYLQHFDIVALERIVDWFNIMSYDLHGTWDKGNQWTGNFLNSHTNLTEIGLALDLLWRNKIDSSKVVLGLAFYGRTFSASSQDCLEPGCTYESGGKKGKCSKETGILLNSEIDDLIAEKGVKPTVYRADASKVATWDDQWVSFDDEETFKLKSEYAQSLCLGGLMVWAISHDTQDAKYNKALAKVTNRKISLAQPQEDGSDKPYEFVDIPNPQCKWSNCQEACPKGWVWMKRSDPGARKDEYLADQSGCYGTTSRAFCCPPSSDMPTCGWYTHNNGGCDPKCPDGTVEIGSNGKYCNNGRYQAACCTTSPKSMRLYTKGEWGQYPNCKETKSCPISDSAKSTDLGVSSSGTGGGACNIDPRTWMSPGIPARDPDTYYLEQRRLCYDTSDEKETFSDCEWHTDIGLLPSNSPKGTCRSGCPDDRVRVAMDLYYEGCNQSGNGGASMCCIPSFSDTIEVENPILDTYRFALSSYLTNPTCVVPDTDTESSLMLRDDTRTTYITSTVQGMLLALLVQSRSQSMMDTMEDIWNTHMEDDFKYLKFPELREYVTDLDEYQKEGPIVVSENIICNPNYWNARLGNKTDELDCTESVCESGECPWDPDVDDDVRHMARSLLASTSNHHHMHHVHDYHHNHGIHPKELSKRARTYAVNLRGEDDSESLFITLPNHPRISSLEDDDPLQDEIIDFVSRGDCGNTLVTHFSLATGQRFSMEHLFDGQTVADFMEDAAAGTLTSGAVAQTPRVSVTFFRRARTMIIFNPPPLPGNHEPTNLYQRIMEAAGSTTNTVNFVITIQDINQSKGILVAGKNAMNLPKLGKAAQSGNMLQVLKILGKLKASIGTIRYLNHRGVPDVNQRLTNIINAMGDQWNHAQTQYNAAYPNDQVQIGGYWSEWVQDFYPWLVSHTQNFVREGIRLTRQYWGVSTHELAPAVLEILNNFESQLDSLTIDTSRMN